MKRLQGSVAVVTGGGNGIGAAICQRFDEEGARVVVADIDLQAATAVSQRLGSSIPWQVLLHQPARLVYACFLGPALYSFAG